ncbi:MAG: hypothetical protein ACRDRW_20060 [Pseudonocardiaceae bacterium]
MTVFERVPAERRNPGSERMARVQQVRAHLALSQLGEVHTQVATCKQRDEPLLCTMREAITVFREQAAVAELTS